MALAEKSDHKNPTPNPQDAGGVSVKNKVLSCFKGIRLLKTLVVVICVAVVVQQITTCIRKLFFDIPVTTYTHFDFNKTIVYPSVTFCREPAYKYHKMMDYGLYSHPRFTSVWTNYNFSNSLDDLWEDITVTEQDIFVQYGFNGSRDNVDIRPTVGFVLGRCYTMTPKTLGTHTSKASGYSITLRHSAADIATVSGVSPPGYHVYVHYTREPFTEVEVYNGGLVQNLFVNAGETIDVQLTVDEYLKLSREDDPCSYEANYSANLCTAQYVWDVVGQQTGCSGPWMTSDLPRCNNYDDMRELITAYMNYLPAGGSEPIRFIKTFMLRNFFVLCFCYLTLGGANVFLTYQSHKCTSCPRFCRSYLYNSLVMDRQRLYSWNGSAKRWSLKTADTALETQFYIYFNSMMVSVYEERYNYDWNLFISDLGGSIGFLLGLSVIGLLKILGKTWDQFIQPFVKSPTKSVSISGSVVTVDVTSIRYPDGADK